MKGYPSSIASRIVIAPPLLLDFVQATYRVLILFMKVNLHNINRATPIGWTGSMWRILGLLLLTMISWLPVSSVIAGEYQLINQSSSTPPVMKWVLLQQGPTGTCVSNTDGCANTFCYGLEYTPGFTGDLTSYTTAFFVDCVMNGNPILTNSSCVLGNSSYQQNGCVELGLMRMVSAGNNGEFSVTAGVPVVIHQVCFSIPPGMTIHIEEDTITKLTSSIDLPGGGFGTDTSSFEVQMLSHSIIVTNLNDSGSSSLRHLVNCAPSGSTIKFSPSLSNQTLVLTSGAININKHLTIAGPGVQAFTISGNNTSGIFHVFPGFDFTLKDLSLINANAVTNGGAIYAQGNVTLQNVLLKNNFQNGAPKSMTVGSGSIIKFVGIVDFKL